MSTTKVTRPLRASILVLAVTVAGTTGCSLFARVFSAMQTIMEPAAPTEECTLRSVPLYPRIDALLGGIGTIPEFHDCQRFIVDSEGVPTYGSPYAIFATKDLKGVWDVVKNATDSLFLVAAIIYSWGDDYDPLGIKAGLNCVYLAKWPGSGLLPIAIVTKYSMLGCIPFPQLSDSSSFALRILATRVVAVSPFDSSDVPSVARWQWDRATGRYYIGIGCGAAWCELFDRTAPPQITTPVAGAPRVAAIKGWYDEQILAGRPAGSGLAVTGVVGTVVPHPDLHEYAEATFTNRWVPVAYVAMSQHHSLYYSKYGFTRAAFAPGKLKRMNQIHLCHGTHEGCDVPASLQCSAPAATDGARWWVRIRSARSGWHWPFFPRTTFLCVNRIPHDGVNIPGTARWRWTDYDETIWIRCGEGCCEVDQDQ